jgi:transcriptional regulator of acetoin/glycerol metabolism
VLERALLVATSPMLRASDLRLNTSVRKTAAPAVDTLKDVEWHHIQRVLQEEKGSVARASKRLGIPRSSLYQKLKLRDTRGPSAA